MSQKQHAEEDSLTCGDPPADMSQKQHAEEDSLAGGDQALRLSAGTGTDSSIRQAKRTGLVISERQKVKREAPATFSLL